MQGSENDNVQIPSAASLLSELPSASPGKVTHQRKGDDVLIKQLKTFATPLGSFLKMV